jgi:hypothetical protein
MRSSGAVCSITSTPHSARSLSTPSPRRWKRRMAGSTASSAAAGQASPRRDTCGRLSTRHSNPCSCCITRTSHTNTIPGVGPANKNVKATSTASTLSTKLPIPTATGHLQTSVTQAMSGSKTGKPSPQTRHSCRSANPRVASGPQTTHATHARLGMRTSRRSGAITRLRQTCRCVSRKTSRECMVRARDACWRVRMRRQLAQS